MTNGNIAGFPVSPVSLTCCVIAMKEPTVAQLRSLYRHGYQLTEVFLQPIHMVRIDERTGNLFILAGTEESIELEIDPEGQLLP